MLENNIFGINERFIDWKSDLNGLVDDYLENHILQEEKTGFIKDCLICVLEDCKEFEYFEMAFANSVFPTPVGPTNVITFGFWPNNKRSPTLGATFTKDLIRSDILERISFSERMSPSLK